MIPDDPNNLNARLGRVIQEYEDSKDSKGWKVSRSAKIIVHEGLVSLMSDQFGLTKTYELSQRERFVELALRSLPQFLSHLQSVASNEIDFDDPISSQRGRVIGGVLVLQYTKVWAKLIPCSCWPQ